MDTFEKILNEIDQGIEIIKLLLEGETRQIAENQIIGLEEAKKIIDRHRNDNEQTLVKKDVKRNKENCHE